MPDDIPIFVPYLGPEVEAAALEAIRGGWIGPGPVTTRFEAEIARVCGVGEGGADRRVVATSSGTAALHAANLAVGIGPGDEVIIPAFDYVAGHQAVSMTGADLVLCDIEDATWGADPASIERLITDRTKAIVLVHFCGVPARTDEILALARARGIRVIEDAAHAFGTLDHGRPIGSFGDLTCFSFGPVKIVTSLEGGAVITGSADEEDMIRSLRVLGIDSDVSAKYQRARDVQYDVLRQGYRYHLGTISASIGLAQVALLDTFIANRRSYCQRYAAAFADLDAIGTQDTDWEGVSPFEFVMRLPDQETRDSLMKHLRELGVGAGKAWIGAHETTFYRDCRRDELPVTEAVSREALIIPLHSVMADETVERVIDGVRSFFVGS